MEEQTNKAHKAARSGSRFKKKNIAEKTRRGIEVQPNRGNNPKAFAGRSAGSHKTKKELRSVEKREHTLHTPFDDKTFSNVVDEPPLLVGVVGPPGSGKTTLIRSMAKFYSHRNIRHLRGPVTVVAGRYRRITFVECPNTLPAMCDLAKVVDLVLLVVDGNFGFEMETFEFLSIAQVHGFPKVIGIVTHLDALTSNKALRRRKNMLRHRFWTEVVAGAKMLTLAPLLHGLYRSNDVMKLHRLLVCVDTKPQAWRNTHSCVLVDRYEDLTNPDEISLSEGKVDRTVALYGYVRGLPLKPGQLVHIPGLGDKRIKHVSHQEDPCSPMTHANAKRAADGGNTKMRHLSLKNKRMYAPYCDVGGVVFDDQAVYLQADPDQEHIRRSGEGYQMMLQLRKADGALDREEAVPAAQRRPAVFANLDSDTLHDVPLERQAEAESDPGSSESDDEDRRGARTRRLEDFGHIAGEMGDGSESDMEGDASGGGALLRPRLPQAADSTRVTRSELPWSAAEDDPTLFQRIKALCVTGVWKGEEEGEEPAAEGGDDLNPYGDRGYESVDSGDEVQGAAPSRLGHAPDHFAELPSSVPDVALTYDDELEGLVEHFVASGHAGPISVAPASLGETLEQHAEPEENDEVSEHARKKAEKKRAFDAAYDTTAASGGATRVGYGFLGQLEEVREEKKKRMQDALAELGDDIDKKVALVGFFSGLYVRIVLEDVPCEFVTKFSPSAPLIVGGLNAGEDQLGIVHLRIKRHRWYPRLLKAQDPLILSIGWRRIQTQPLFATEDANGRLRYLKYSPEHMHCVAAFFGPVTPPNAGIVAIPSATRSGQEKAFRISATGYTISADGSTAIVKKLKLTGVPQQIQKTTCFVKGMFNSDLEAALFVGAKCRAVSGIRGMIKKVIKGKHGIVRCTFEDKLLPSDIVFVRTWKPVQPPRYCVTVQNLLDPEWRGMRPMALLRRDYNEPLQQKPDSEYREVQRKVVLENETVPTTRNLRLRLPFSEKEYISLDTKKTALQEKVQAATIVAPEPRDVRRKALIGLLSERAETLDAQQEELRRIAKRKTQREQEKDDVLYQQKVKKAKKETARKNEFRTQHKSRAHKKARPE